MHLRSLVFGLSLVAMGTAPLHAFAEESVETDRALKQLGKYVFFDKISIPSGVMSCATCHTPSTGGTNGDSLTNLHQVGVTGADGHSVGGLKPPTNAYASFIKPFDVCTIGGVSIDGQQFCGGNFWNGRAEGHDLPLFEGATRHIGPEVFQSSTDPNILAHSTYFGPTSDQALNPMPNPVEQNIPRKAVCEHVMNAAYAPLYELAWGEPLCCSEDIALVQAPDVTTPERGYDIAFKRLMLAVGAWQASPDLNSFSSKRDIALRAELACVAGAEDADPAVCTHPDYLNSPGKFPLAGFSAEENLGHDLFYNTAFPRGTPPFPNLPVTNCSFCHLSDTAARDGTGLLERYADDAYHNIGVPVNVELPAAPDLGHAGHAQSPAPANNGGFKTPTLRNVDKRPSADFVKAYTHNGWFKSLESLVHFYNTSRVLPRCVGPVTEEFALANNCWPEPEWPTTLATNRLVGAIGMTPEQETAVVAYLKTLSDTHTARAPKPYYVKPKDPPPAEEPPMEELPPQDPPKEETHAQDPQTQTPTVQDPPTYTPPVQDPPKSVDVPKPVNAPNASTTPPHTTPKPLLPRIHNLTAKSKLFSKHAMQPSRTVLFKPKAPNPAHNVTSTAVKPAHIVKPKLTVPVPTIIITVDYDIGTESQPDGFDDVEDVDEKDR